MSGALLLTVLKAWDNNDFCCLFSTFHDILLCQLCVVTILMYIFSPKFLFWDFQVSVGILALGL